MCVLAEKKHMLHDIHNVLDMLDDVLLGQCTVIYTKSPS